MSGSTAATVRVILQLAWRSLASHKIKSLIVGGIMAFGTMLFVVGTSLLDSVESAMQRSITNSVTGHMQVYSADARDELAIFGGMMMGGEEIGEIEDFSEVRSALEEIPNVEAVVPMGTNNATVMTGNDFDRVLTELRDAIDAQDPQALAASIAQVRSLAEFTEDEYEKRLAISSDTERIQDGIALLQRVQTDDFWADFDDDPTATLRFLDTRVAPLASDGRTVFLRSIGTDLHRFATYFDRFKITDGEMVPQGKRGFLLNKRMHEKWLKHIVARTFDAVHAAREEGDTIAEDAGLRAQISQMQSAYPQILFQLSPDDAIALTEALRARDDLDGVGPESDLAALLEAFLDVDDDNFDARYDAFYDLIAPKIRLYLVNVGDEITLRSVTKSGYFKAVNVKIYGRFTFEGLERSDLSGVFNLVDIMTFRDLYGLMTDEQRAELAGIREDVGVEEVSRDNAEDALFGGSSELVVEDATETGTASETGIDLNNLESIEGVDLSAAARDSAFDQTFTQEDIDRGLAQHAAIVLDDPDDPEALESSMEAVRATIDEHDLGLQVVDWQEASGIVGQFVIVIRLVLYVAITIIFLVALVIINNSMVMATMDRIGEIGTMRAIGAQRRFVLSMFLLETLTLGLLAGVLGALGGAGIIAILGNVGIPANSDVLVFLFSGPRLYPQLYWTNVLFGLGVIALISVVATLYPAIIATRVQPVEAMRTE